MKTENKNISLEIRSVYLGLSFGTYETSIGAVYTVGSTLENELYENYITQGHVDQYWIQFDDDKYNNMIIRIAEDAIKDLFKNYGQKLFGIDFKLSDFIMESPAEYNFRTDDIYFNITFPADDIGKLKSKCLSFIKENEDLYNEAILDNFSSYDGFCSFISNDVELLPKALRSTDPISFKDDDIYFHINALMGLMVRALIVEDDLDINDKIVEEICNEGYNYLEFLDNTPESKAYINSISKHRDLVEATSNQETLNFK